MTDKAQFGIIGMAVMGRNLALNVLDHGFSCAAWNLEPEMTDTAVAESENRLVGTTSLEAFVGALEKPRKILMMIRAGKPVDIVLSNLEPLLEEGDIVIDGGNSWFKDTQRREASCREKGVRFFGVGVSGGEEGARRGPSLMPGGDAEAYKHIEPILKAISAKTDSGDCVTHCGTDGAGHFVKMVHNGIEYADMQFIAEAYHLMRSLLGLEPPKIGEVFSKWNEGALNSFLIEITAKIFTVADPQKEGAWLVDAVLDKAKQKGTGKWTAQIALDLGVPVPSIGAAIDGRVLSSFKDLRVQSAPHLNGPGTSYDGDAEELIADIHDALYAAKIGAYAQGLHLIATASNEFNWGTNLRETARIWKGGCIIRARFLDDIMKAYERNPNLPNLLLDPVFTERIHASQNKWRKVVSLAIQNGIPVPAMASSLAYYDSIRTANLPQNLTQAQRDAFGAHTYVRSDDDSGAAVHTDWLD